MIKYYTYYSCGGYKDIYIGSDQDTADASYFIPLLNVWKKSNRPENADKIARAENVQHIELISKSNSAGFPSECDLMFSHGGYKAILRTLKDGRQCLSIRDIANGTKDEEGRDIPFNFLFLADGQESIDQLDALAISYLTRNNEIDELLSSAISYDPVINGVRFDLAKLNQLLINQQAPSKKLFHKAGIIDYLKIGSRNQYKMSLTEQALDVNNINSLWDDNGLFYGDFDYLEESSELAEEVKEKNEKTEQSHLTVAASEVSPEDSVSAQIEAQVNEDEPMVTNESIQDDSKANSASLESIIESRLQQIDHKISSLATSESLDKLQSLFTKLSNESNSILSDIQEQLTKQTENANMVQITSKNHDDGQFPFNKSIIIAIGCLIVGSILGALIF